MDEGARLPLESFALRDRDVMNLLDQLELYTLQVGKGGVSQQDYRIFVYRSMKSGLLMTKTMETHLRYKLAGVGAKLPARGPDKR